MKVGELRRRIGELEGESRVSGEKIVALEALNEELKQLVTAEQKKVLVEEGRAKQAEAFLNIGAITPLGAAPAGFAQQCPRCDNSSSEVGLHKIPCTWGELSTA